MKSYFQSIKEIQEFEIDMPDNWRINKRNEKSVEDSSCLHDGCPECKGTGRKKNGGFCVHGLSCNCSKCSVR